uniref:Uncharacterized protein n=1 Tax=Cynoglossus semilaevis TaxID=244447 RepID=A0A3P8UV48_CYNSE
MAGRSYCEHLTCGICLSIFTDPVTLACGHSFCRLCITDERNSKNSCPQCRTPVVVKGALLPTSHILKSLADKAKDRQRMENETAGNAKGEVKELCPEHQEELTLFCVTDQQLACMMCRHGERHQKHRFQRIDKADVALREKLENLLQQVSNDVNATERRHTAQREEITKAIQKSEQLTNQIHRQFEEMHVFLREREAQILTELKHREEDAVQKMSMVLSGLEEILTQNAMLMGKLASTLEVREPDKFIKCWTENNSTSPNQIVFQPRANEFQVVNSWLSLGPYESHLQFFVWKEMLKVIQPRAELLSFRRSSPDITVSDDGRSLFCTPRTRPPQMGPRMGINPANGSAQTMPNPAQSTAAQLGQLIGFPYFGSSARFDQIINNPTFGQAISTPSVVPTAGFGQNRSGPVFNPRAFGQFMPNLPGSTAGFGQNRHNPPNAGFGQTMNNIPLGANRGFGQPLSASTFQALSVNEFYCGQHYWEIDVGHREYWELGIRDNFLKYNEQKYSICSSHTVTELMFEGKPRKIGVYLNCPSKKISFYDADNMTHIDTLSTQGMSFPLPAYFNVRFRTPDPNPMTVCWY